MELTENKIATLLRQHGYKLTSQRRTVISAVFESRERLTPAEIYEKAHRNNPRIGLVTIYRTLEILSGLGLICELHAGGSCHSYLIKTSFRHHHHLICSDCGKVVNFEDCDLSGLEKHLSKATGFQIQSHILEFLGLCKGCSSMGAK